MAFDIIRTYCDMLTLMSCLIHVYKILYHKYGV